MLSDNFLHTMNCFNVFRVAFDVKNSSGFDGLQQ